MRSVIRTRRRRQGRRVRVDTRLVVGTLLVCVSILGGLRLSASAQETVPVLAATHDLPAGHILGRDDVAVVQVKAPADSVRALVSSGDVARVRGRVVRAHTPRGALLVREVVGAPRDAGPEVTVPVTAEHALGGSLRPGDRIDVLGSFDKGTAEARTLTIASGAEVVDVIRSDGLFGQRQGSVSALTIAVPDGDAVLVTYAVRNGEIDVVRSDGTTASKDDRFDASQLP